MKKILLIMCLAIMLCAPMQCFAALKNYEDYEGIPDSYEGMVPDHDDTCVFGFNCFNGWVLNIVWNDSTMGYMAVFKDGTYESINYEQYVRYVYESGFGESTDCTPDQFQKEIREYNEGLKGVEQTDLELAVEIEYLANIPDNAVFQPRTDINGEKVYICKTEGTNSVIVYKISEELYKAYTIESEKEKEIDSNLAQNVYGYGFVDVTLKVSDTLMGEMLTIVYYNIETKEFSEVTIMPPTFSKLITLSIGEYRVSEIYVKNAPEFKIIADLPAFTTH